MTARPIQTRSLIDEFLPSHDFSEAYKTRISASRPVVYRTLLHSDFSEPWLVRFLAATQRSCNAYSAWISSSDIAFQLLDGVFLS